jgi:hypothetical protein
VTPQVKPSEFGTEWHAWWVAIQPAWRKPEGTNDGWPLSRHVPKGADWTALEHGGANGLFLVLMALSWWGAEIPSQCNKQHDKFMIAVDDVDWVVSELLKKISTGEKRAIETASKEQPPMKR